MTATLLDDVAAFSRDPVNVSQDVVDRIKQALRDRYRIPTQYDVFVAPVRRSNTSVRLIVKECGVEIASFCVDLAELMTEEDQQEEEHVSEPFFSTDPEWLLKHLSCDGGCGRAFCFEDDVHTLGNTQDYCCDCVEHLPAGQRSQLVVRKVRERIEAYASEQTNAVMGLIGF